MTIASVLDLPRRAVAGEASSAHGFDPTTQELYVELVRINCVAQVLFAASIALGEILVADRRFLFYALAPILYTAGIIVVTVLFAGRATGSCARPGAPSPARPPTSAIRAIGTTRTSFRIRAGLAVRTAAFREFLRLMVPRMFSVAIEPLTHHVLHGGRGGHRRRRGVGPQLRARLPGPAGQPHRRRRSRWPSSRVLSAAFAADDGPAFRDGPRPERGHHRGPDDARGGRAVPPRRAARRACCSAAAVRAR